MKVLGIPFDDDLLFGFSLMMDILSDVDISTALRNTINPFVVMEAAEFLVLLLSLLMVESFVSI